MIKSCAIRGTFAKLPHLQTSHQEGMVKQNFPFKMACLLLSIFISPTITPTLLQISQTWLLLFKGSRCTWSSIPAQHFSTGAVCFAPAALDGAAGRGQRAAHGSRTPRRPEPQPTHTKEPVAEKPALQTETMVLMMEALSKCCIHPGRLGHNSVFRTRGKVWNNETQPGKWATLL